MLAYYVDWHMRKELAPMLFDDEDKEAALAPAQAPSPRRRVRTGRKPKTPATDEDGQPVHSFHTLIADLSTLWLNERRRDNRTTR